MLRTGKSPLPCLTVLQPPERPSLFGDRAQEAQQRIELHICGVADAGLRAGAPLHHTGQRCQTQPFTTQLPVEELETRALTTTVCDILLLDFNVHYGTGRDGLNTVS